MEIFPRILQASRPAEIGNRLRHIGGRNMVGQLQLADRINPGGFDFNLHLRRHSARAQPQTANALIAIFNMARAGQL